jgi:hypothetical protein
MARKVAVPVYTIPNLLITTSMGEADFFFGLARVYKTSVVDPNPK